MTDTAQLRALVQAAKDVRAQAATLPHYFPGDSATKVPVLAEIIQGHFNDIAERIERAAAALGEQPWPRSPPTC